ncbi:SDR family oxidoreductase [Rhizobium sp. C4]|uniref:SDR family oxidoreductase n=1 Tax=Rhizobium sp. C4 TaxID=1349800 RepID=UPI001E61B9AC|nr:SDR family oxidoreductase [Rhizobium sp. C4]MCD2173498.1 SDR family oxidoreductase [Rhizobium sp. C4]
MADVDAKGIALVTGGGTGVGKAMVRALADTGWTVVIAGRRLEVLDEAIREFGPESSAKVHAIVADVGIPGSVRALFEEVESRFGRLDLLVNNAGSGAPAVPLDELDVEDWNRVVAANLTGAFLCTQQAFRIMKAQTPRGGRIINNGSISATTPRPNSAPYTATKHAITGLTKSCALDGRAFDIACGQIDIGNAATDMTERMRAGIVQPNGETMVEPTIDPKLVADAVVYMAGLPLDANVLTMTVMATKMPFVGRG